MKTFVGRVAYFSAGHRLHSNKLSVEENERIFGKCNSKNGHGHNYKLEVTLEGEIDKVTGMIANLSTVDAIIQDVIATVDHRNLDKDVEYFKEHTSTVENIAVYLGELLKARLPLLHKVKVWETEKNFAIYKIDG